MFNIKFSLIAAFLLFFTQPALAGQVAECVDHKNFKTEVIVSFTPVELAKVEYYDFSEIQKNRNVDFYKWKHPAESHVWISDDESLNSYYRLGLGVSSKTEVHAMPRPRKINDGFFCVFLKSIHFDLYLGSMAFVDQRYRDVGCKDFNVDLSKFLQRRHNQALETMVRYRREIEEAIKKPIAAIERKAVKQDKAELKAARVHKIFKDAAAKYAQNIHDEIVELNSRIKPDQNLFNHQKNCQSSLMFMTQ